MTTQRTLTARPDWVVKECLRVKGTEDYSPDNAVCNCERCGAPLFAQVWTIEETANGRVWRVGSTCVKALTGSTISQLQGLKAAYLGSMALDAEERELKAHVSRFIEANADTLAWLDSHIEAVHLAGERILRERGASIGGPALPSAEFWESLREQAHTKGAFSEGQAAAISKERAINKDAKLAVKGDKGFFSGTITNTRARLGFDGKTWDVEFELPQTDGGVYQAKAAFGTSFRDALETLCPVGPLGFDFSHEKKARQVANALNGQAVTIKATVKGQRAVGGKAYLTRSSLSQEPRHD